MQPEFYALITAMCFGFTAVNVRKGIKKSNAVTATLVISSVQAVVFTVMLLFNRPTFNTWGVVYFIASGFFAATIGRTLNYMSIDRLGVAVASSLSGTNPLFTILFASLFIGEKVEASTFLGAAMVVAGVALISGWGRDGGLKPKDVALPLLSASAYAFSSLFRKMALNVLPEAILGSVIGVMTSIVSYAVALTAMNKLSELKASRSSLLNFTIAGFSNSVAWISLYTATQEGSVSVVSAIIAANPLFGLILSALLLKETEKITARVVAGCLVIVSGVMLITLL